MFDLKKNKKYLNSKITGSVCIFELIVDMTLMAHFYITKQDMLIIHANQTLKLK